MAGSPRLRTVSIIVRVSPPIDHQPTTSGWSRSRCRASTRWLWRASCTCPRRLIGTKSASRIRQWSSRCTYGGSGSVAPVSVSVVRTSTSWPCERRCSTADRQTSSYPPKWCGGGKVSSPPTGPPPGGRGSAGAPPPPARRARTRRSGAAGTCSRPSGRARREHTGSVSRRDAYGAPSTRGAYTAASFGEVHVTAGELQAQAWPETQARTPLRARLTRLAGDVPARELAVVAGIAALGFAIRLVFVLAFRKHAL